MRLTLLASILFVGLGSAQYSGYKYSGYKGYGYQYSGYQGYQYTYYEATWYKGRWYPAGNYYNIGQDWYLKGYGKFNGYDAAPAVKSEPEQKSGSGLTDEEIKKLKEILKNLEKK
jgi:hypothetical protein